MKPIAVFRHSLTEGPGHIATYMKGIGRDIKVVAIDRGDVVPHDPTAFAGLCFMGGPMSVNDRLPWIPEVLALIRRATEGGSYHVKVSLTQTSMWVQRLGLEPGFEPREERRHFAEGLAPLLETRPSAYGPLQQLPPVAQFSRLMSVMITSTESGAPPRMSTLTRVISATSFFFCSRVRPSIISTW